MADYYILKNDKRLSDAIDIKGAHRVINIDHIKTNSLQFIDSNPTLAFVLMGIYAVFFLVLMTKIFEWAAAYNAKPGVIPLQADALISGIINLPNDMPNAIALSLMGV